MTRPTNDVALERLTSPVRINDAAQTLALPESTPLVVANLLGWGWTFAPAGTPSTVLQQVNLPITD